MAEKSLHDRIESYYDSWKALLPPRMPICIRCDGRGFSKLTRRCEKPYDNRVSAAMEMAARELCQQSGAAVGYTQSDEVTVLLTPYKRFESQAWFGGECEKLCSVSASICADTFSRFTNFDRGCVSFDARVAVVPRDDVHNVFVDRQQDGRRNAILGLGQKHIGKKKIHGMSCEQIVEELRLMETFMTISSSERLLSNQGYMNGRVILRGEGRDGWRAEPAPDFKVLTNYFYGYVWPEDEEGREGGRTTSEE
jgi:tRNA(His) guanylyltransferase